MTISFPTYFAKFDFKSSTQHDEEVGEICIANISPLERQKRLQFGIKQFVITLFVLGALLVFDVNHFWRLPLLFLFWAAAVGYFQAKDKT
jgi:hypothetical protein